MIDRSISEAMRLRPNATRTEIATTLVESGTGRWAPLIFDAAVSPLVGVAEALGACLWEDDRRVSFVERSEAAARDVLGTTPDGGAIALLAAIVPHAVYHGELGGIDGWARGLLRRELPVFCRRVLDDWAQWGFVVNVGGSSR